VDLAPASHRARCPQCRETFDVPGRAVARKAPILKALWAQRKAAPQRAAEAQPDTRTNTLTTGLRSQAEGGGVLLINGGYQHHAAVGGRRPRSEPPAAGRGRGVRRVVPGRGAGDRARSASRQALAAPSRSRSKPAAPRRAALNRPAPSAGLRRPTWAGLRRSGDMTPVAGQRRLREKNRHRLGWRSACSSHVAVLGQRDRGVGATIRARSSTAGLVPGLARGGSWHG
jgi:hypothetical protein